MESEAIKIVMVSMVSSLQTVEDPYEAVIRNQ